VGLSGHFLNISSGFPFRFASAIGQMSGLLQEPPNVVCAWGRKVGIPSKPSKAFVLFQREEREARWVLADFLLSIRT
jgi:hypothetical protein